MVQYALAGLAAFDSIVPNVPAPSEEGCAVNKEFRIFINGGSGGTGTFGIHIAKVLGCYVDLCKSFGADEVLDYNQEDLVSMLKAKGQVFDHVVDNVGSALKDLYTAAGEFLVPSGHFGQVGAGLSMADMGAKFSHQDLSAKDYFSFQAVS